MKIPRVPSLVFAVAVTSQAYAETNGELLFTQNCSACHMLDQQVVGPSLVEIRSLYLNKPDDFLKWCLAPEKKRPDTIEMPSMAHIPEAGLREIHAHIMSVADGVKQVKAKAGDPFAGAAAQNERPLVQRIFMPNAGPAAIAVALDPLVSLCWDAGVCRLRYVWTGGFIDGYPYWKGNGSDFAKIVGSVRYTEKNTPLGDTTGAKFKGYDIVEGLPVFKYALGATEVAESFKALPGGKGIERHFQISGKRASSLTAKIENDSSVKIECNKGAISSGTLTLSPADAADFTLTYEFQ